MPSNLRSSGRESAWRSVSIMVSLVMRRRARPLYKVLGGMPVRFAFCVTAAFVAHVASAAEVSRARLAEGAEREMPVKICATKYFQQCFSVSSTECEQAARGIAKRCLDETGKQVPENVRRDQATDWGRRAGWCLGTRLDAAFAKQKNASPECLSAQQAQ